MTHKESAELSELLQAVAGGDADALAELYRQLKSPIYTYALSLLGDREQAAEVLNEVMVEVWRRADRFRGRSRLLTWVLGITRHKVFDSLRRFRRWQPEPPPGEDVADDDALTPLERLHRDERSNAVRQALGGLSEDQRELVDLAFYQELSYSEISHLLGIPQGTVKTRMLQTKKVLRRRLAGRLSGVA